MNRERVTQAAFSSLARALEEADKLGFPDTSRDRKLIKIEFQKLRTEYALKTAASRVDMVRTATKNRGYDAYSNIIDRKNFMGTLHSLSDRIVRFLQKDLELAKIESKANSTHRRGGRVVASFRESSIHALIMSLTKLFKHGQDAASSKAPKNWSRSKGCDDVGDCPECGVSLCVDGAQSQARCPECAQLFELHGVTFDEAQFKHQEGQRSKSGKFNPNHHCQEWMVRIQGLEPETELGDPKDDENTRGEKLIANIRAEARRTGRLLAMLEVEDVRTLLSNIKMSQFNRNASLILKKLTGVAPPILCEEKKVRAEIMFSMANAARAEICSDSSNRSYYPYYIFKILDLILDFDDPDRLLMCYIHMQGENTIDNNDAEWAEICKRTGWEWRSTNLAVLETYRRRFG